MKISSVLYFYDTNNNGLSSSELENIFGGDMDKVSISESIDVLRDIFEVE
jgi:hypothetical protein